MQTQVLISKLRDNPEIQIGVTRDGMTILIAMGDFLDAVASEMGSPIKMITKAQLSKHLHEAARRVQANLQKESKRVI